MGFTSGNDINILQATDSGVVGAGLGDDIYVLSADQMADGQEINISDADGANALRLVGGLTITSSKVASDTIQLTLSNGAIVNILGASSFTFEVGGTGLATSPVVQDFTTFVTNSMGLAAVPAAGEVVDGPADLGVNEDGTTTEGGGSTPATFTFAASADEINEGEANTFTVTASAPVEQDTEVTFQLALGTAQLDDFSAGSFNAIKVTIPAGETTATYAYKAIGDDGTELSETYSVSASVGGTVVGTAEVTILDGGAGAGQTFTLTKGIDNIVGTSGNDTINASWSAAADQPFGGLDVIDGAAGTDTLNVADSATAAGTAFTFGGATIKNVENIVVSTNGKFDGLDVSKVAGLTSFTATSSDTAAATITAADTTDVALTTATINASTITGGKVVSVTKGAAAVGTLGVAGKALADITIKGGAGVVTINNQDAAATANKGTTLKTVTLDGVDAATGIGGEGLESVTVKGATTAASTVTITNAKADHALTINVDGTGYKADGSEVQTVVTDTVAKTLTVNATGSKSSLDVSGSTTATAVNVTGAAALKLDVDVANIKSVDGSAATGNLNLGTINAATTTVKTGSGNDQFTLGAAKLTVDAGAGNDIVTLSGAVAAGSTIALGAGNDTLLAAAGSVAASTVTAITSIDAGDGTDSVAANLITAGNAAQFKNFELLNLDSTTGLDLALLAANNTLTGLTMSSASTTATYQNVSKAFGLTVDFIGNNSADVNTLQLKDATGTADAYTITFAADNSAATSAPTAANVQAGRVITAGIENYNIVSGGAKAWNEITLGANTSAQTVTITGAANLDLDFNGAFGSTTAPATGVTLIDGSAATGKLDINTTNVVAATAGLTVKGGSANDTILLAQKATVDAGAGDDTITVSSAGGTITTGAGKDMVDVKAAVTGSTSAPVITTIADFTLGSDKLTFADKGTETFTATKVDVGTATALFGGTVNALDLAATADATTNAAITWFQYAGDTYVVQDLSASTTAFTATDIVVKLTGLVDLSTLTVADFTFA